MELNVVNAFKYHKIRISGREILDRLKLHIENGQRRSNGWFYDRLDTAMERFHEKNSFSTFDRCWPLTAVGTLI